jgi:hypothetical protein
MATCCLRLAADARIVRPHFGHCEQYLEPFMPSVNNHLEQIKWAIREAERESAADVFLCSENFLD